ncbi:hypothetical protein RI129_003786 [Pyrocoelia pectoralis]|uniref:Uncharacterized protein n=1 Tax=Pyrocoelia pectoralis TaxID=417401 RepID=A0AAN7VQ45_9COLE
MNGDTYIVNTGSASGVYVPSVNQGLPTLIVMVVVLVIIMLFCFWGAPAIRAFCKRRICCCCTMDEPSIENVSATGESTTPTIILLPYGRMLVVDRNIFTQLQADRTGIDFMELSANLIRAQNLQNGSRTSTFMSEDTSKGLSTVSLDFLPPAYEDIFGIKNSDLPPSYSEISLMLKKLSGKHLSNEQIDENEQGVIMAKPKECILRTSSAPFIFTDRVFEGNTRLMRNFGSLNEDIERNFRKNVEECRTFVNELFQEDVAEVASGFSNPRYQTSSNRTNREYANFRERVDRESSV